MNGQTQTLSSFRGKSVLLNSAESRRGEFLAALKRYFSFEILAVTTDARDSTEFTVRTKDHRGIFGFQITGHTRVIAAAAMTDVMDVQIEMIAPEEWRDREGFACAENIARGGLTLTLSHNPVFHTDPAGARIGPAGNVARRKNSGNARFQKLVYQHTVVSRDARLLSKMCVWAHTKSNNH